MMRIVFAWLFACSWIATAAGPLVITTTQIPDALAGQPYSFQLQATGGTPPYRWKGFNSLQDGIEFDTDTGLLHGTPTIVGISFTVQVTDSAGQAAAKAFTVRFWGPVQLAGSLPPPNTGFGAQRNRKPA